MPDTDPAASVLDGIRTDLAHLRACADAIPVNPGAFDLEVLMPRYGRAAAAVEAALKLTEPTSEVHRDLDGNEEGGAVRVVRCDVLRDAITAALAGEEAGDGDGS